MKKILTEAPVLIPPEAGKEFVVYCDASHTGLGCVLMQEGKMVAYASRQLRSHEYHPGKANMVADALSRKVVSELRAMFAHLSLYEDGSLLAELQVKPSWVNQIKKKQLLDESLGSRFQQVKSGETVDLGLNSDEILCFRGRVCMLNDSELRQMILWEAHSSPYAMHPDGSKMYRDLREQYWWPGLK
ncbi:integrase [Gossypium australe]|uniref:Integrase n=1 Tax=Gossypium australe TaxID=47621 RepID=A0A5B6WTV0_9ROSI|nr:integrase [Gossypium australe]